MMIKSDRRFGVEVEFICPTQRSINQIRQQLNIVEDGSLRPHRYAGEWVTPILQGSSGEEAIHHGCMVLKKNRASAEEACTSVHVHLDGRNERIVTKTNKMPSNTENCFAVSNALYKSITQSQREALSRGSVDFLVPSSTSIDGIRYYSLSPIFKHPTANYTYFTTHKPDRFAWLQKVFYFYTLYSQVMEGIVSNSRKFGNMYCIPLGESYDVDKILACKDMNQLSSVWYKGSRSGGGHYDNSRYHNVNLHSFFNGHGTVEIRSHGGTIDPQKIMLWVHLHQQIVDKLETCRIEDIKPKSDNIYQDFVDFLPDQLSKAYVKRLLGYYSNIKVK